MHCVTVASESIRNSLRATLTRGVTTYLDLAGLYAKATMELCIGPQRVLFFFVEEVKRPLSNNCSLGLPRMSCTRGYCSRKSITIYVVFAYTVVLVRSYAVTGHLTRPRVLILHLGAVLYGDVESILSCQISLRSGAVSRVRGERGGGCVIVRCRI